MNIRQIQFSSALTATLITTGTMNQMSKIAIVYHSGYGHTAAVAESVYKGALSVDGSEVQLIKVDEVDAHWDDLAAADAIIFGAPTYMGSASAQFKTFADASSKVWMAQGWANKIAAGFTNSASPSGEKVNTLNGFIALALQHGMIWVGQDLLPGGNHSTSTRDANNWVGSALGLATQSNADQGADIAPPAGDHATSEHFGKRIAIAAARWAAGAK